MMWKQCAHLSHRAKFSRSYHTEATRGSERKENMDLSDEPKHKKKTRKHGVYPTILGNSHCRENRKVNIIALPRRSLAYSDTKHTAAATAAASGARKKKRGKCTVCSPIECLTFVVVSFVCTSVWTLRVSLLPPPHRMPSISRLASKQRETVQWGGTRQKQKRTRERRSGEDAKPSRFAIK
jgi:hypothetical protein